MNVVSSFELYTGNFDASQRSKMRQIRLQKVIKSIVGKTSVEEKGRKREWANRRWIAIHLNECPS